MLLVTVGLSVCHPRGGGDPEGEFFQTLRAKGKRKVNLVNTNQCSGFATNKTSFAIQQLETIPQS